MMPFYSQAFIFDRHSCAFVPFLLSGRDSDVQKCEVLQIFKYLRNTDGFTAPLYAIMSPVF